MLFHTWTFAAFFTVFYLVYRSLGRRSQNVWCLLASFVFYGSWDYRFLALLLFSIVLDYKLSLAISKSPRPRARLLLLLLSVVGNLGILGVFKYYDFFIESAASFSAALGFGFHPTLMNLILPLGISFYTFQTIGYTVDVYFQRIEPERDFIDYALYVSFFPQLIAGPIERASNLLPQIKKERQISGADLTDGFRLFFWGMIKKIVIADNLAAIVDPTYTLGATPSGWMVIIATYAFAIQIYCDFSGYTDMARGLAQMMGFHLVRNFNLPYFATDVADFWRRWHISLSSWLKDYAFMPMAQTFMRRFPGKPELATGIALFFTFTLVGLWHGAGWNFILWGAYFGILMWIGHAMRGRSLMDGRIKFPPFLKIIATFHLICFGWIFFRAENLGHVGDLLTALIGQMHGKELLAVFAANITPGAIIFTLLEHHPWFLELCSATLGFLAITSCLFLAELLYLKYQDPLFINRWPRPVRAMLYVAGLYMIVLFGSQESAPFIYFQF